MEKKFSIDEVNNFLKKFKEKRGKKSTAPTTTNIPKTQIFSSKVNKEEDNIFSNNNNNSTPDNIFGTQKSENIFDDNNMFLNKKNKENNLNNEEEIFQKSNENSNNNNFLKKNENINVINSKKESDFDLFKTKNDNNSEDFDLFNNNGKNSENIFGNNENEKKDLDLFQNDNKDDIFNTQLNDNKNKNNFIKHKNIINNFQTGIVLNNPLEKDQNKKEEISKEEYNIFQEKNDNHNIENYNNENDNNDINNINNNYECNNEIRENSSEIKEENYISDNNIYYKMNEDNNDLINNNKEIFDNTEEVKNIYYYENKISNNEVEKLDEDQNNIQLNYNNMINKPPNKPENISDKKDINNFEQNSDLKLNYKVDLKNESLESYDFSSIEQNYVFFASNEKKIITINNIYSMLNYNYENMLYENYFPVSYSKEPDLNNLINLLNIIINNGNELNEPLGHIIAYLFKFMLENKLNLEKINILQNGDLKNVIIQILSKEIQKENKDIISLNNLFNIESLYNQNNSSLEYNIANEALIHPLEFILNLFNEKILNKNNLIYLYFLLLNIKENNEFYNHGLGLDEYDYIFDNFECALFIILRYLGNDINKIKNVCNTLLNSFSSKIKFCHFIILKCLLGDFDIKNGKNYGNIFMNFLQFPNIEKIIIADIFNFILFTASSKFKKVVAKSSILIKYKYSILKQNNNPEQNLLILNQKIFENIHQFGSISKNSFFHNYLKDFSSNKRLNISQTNNSSKKQKEENFSQNNIQKNNINNPEAVQQQKGLFSKFINAFGFGGSENNNDNNNINNNKISEEDKRRMTPSELWKLEHPGQPEIEYDPILKRYKLRGIIYDDQEEVVKKKEMDKPIVAPPKSKKYEEKKKNINENNLNNKESINNNNNEEEENIFSNKNSGMSGGPGSNSNRINNPFGYSQIKNQKNSKNNQKQNNKGLNQRYAVAYKK